MDSLVIECIVRLSEEVLVSLTFIKRGVVLAWHKMHNFGIQFAHYAPELFHASLANTGIVGGLGEISGENDKVWFLFQAIHFLDRFDQRTFSIRVDFVPLKAPMAV